MATVDKRLGTVTGPLMSSGGRKKPFMVERVIDYKADALGATDVVQVIALPKGTLVLAAGAEVLTADTAGNSGTVAVSDGTSTWVAAAVTTSTGYMTKAAVDSTLITADTSLTATGAVGTINSKVRYFAVLVDCTTYQENIAAG